ncbi:MAG: hypothetical protein ACTTH0_02235 [Eubacteriales bacterium]
MARQSAYENLISNISKNEDFKDAFPMIINNPYRILGASTFDTPEQLKALYELWKEDPDKYKSPYDKSKLGVPNRTQERMEYALENSDSYAYKIFWFSDAEKAARLGNKADFIEFFAKKQNINTTDYNSFLAQYIFLCIFDREFTLTEQWGIVLNLINDLLNVSVGRFWAFFSENKIEPLDNNKMTFLYNEFKDNILFPIREIASRINGKIDIDEVVHIHSIIGMVERPQLPFARIQNVLYEKLEKWFIKEADYVNNVLLNNVSGISDITMEEKLATVDAYNYVIDNVVPSFERIVGNIIPAEHSMNTRLRMMFSGKFIVVAKILSNAGMYNESLKLCQIFNNFFEDEYISGEISTLSKILKQDEVHRMSINAAATVMGNRALDKNSGYAMPAGLGELEQLEKTRKNEFFQKKQRTGIDYKEVIQGVLNKEMKLVDSMDNKANADIPYAERMLQEEAAVAEREAARMKLIMADLQKRHELELQDKIEELNSKYKQSMKKWIVALVVILILLVAGTAFVAVQLFFTKASPTPNISQSNSLEHKNVDTNDLESMKEALDIQKIEISELEERIEAANLTIAELSTKYFETNEQEYLDRMNEKKSEYEKIYSQYTEKVNEYNALNKRYKKKAGKG